MSDAGSNAPARQRAVLWMRRVHRWLSVLAAIFLLIVATTGVILQIQRLNGEEDQDSVEHPPVASVTAPNAQFDAILNRVLDAARTRHPNAQIASVAVQGDKDGARGIVMLAGDPGRVVTVDGDSGHIVADVEREDDLVMRIHSGEILGEPGVLLGLFWGSALLLLLCTGTIIYLDMYARRAQVRGKGAVFW